MKLKILAAIGILFCFTTVVFAEEYTITEKSINDIDVSDYNNNEVSTIFYTEIEAGYSFLSSTSCGGPNVTLVAGIQPFVNFPVEAVRELSFEFDFAVINLFYEGKHLSTITPILGVFYMIGFSPEAHWTLDIGTWFGFSFWPGAKKPADMNPTAPISLYVKLGPSFILNDRLSLSAYYQVDFNQGTDQILGLDTTHGMHAIESVLVGLRYKFPKTW